MPASWELFVSTPERRSLQEGWVELLGRYEWHWFCTMTFRDATHPERADKLFRLWNSKLNRMLFGARWHKKTSRITYWARGLEYQRRDVIHYHALVGCRAKNLNHHALRRYWGEAWNDLAGFARIEEVRSTVDTVRYLTKYITKGGEIDTSPNLDLMPTSYTLRDIEKALYELEHSPS